MKKKFTDKQKRFIEEYMIDLNATQASIRSGYSKKTAEIIGFENLRKPNIATEITKRKAKLSVKTEITTEYVVTSLQKVADRCMQVKPILNKDGSPKKVKDGTGKIMAGHVFDSSGANRSLELLGKHTGAWEKDNLQKSEITVKIEEMRRRGEELAEKARVGIEKDEK